MERGMWGLDMRRGLDPAWDLHGQYSTDIYTNRAIDIISNHTDLNVPLFLYLAHTAVHSGNPYNPLPAPDHIVSQFSNITNYERQRFAAMLTKLDYSVGKVVHTLEKKGMLSNTIIVFTTDNGGPSAGFDFNAASNWPLRGVKNTLWEGGVRGAGFIWSSSLKPKVSKEMMHVSDWLPTLLAAVNDNRTLEGIDGVSSWDFIVGDNPSRRKSVLHNIDDIWGSSALTTGDWKLVKGANYNGWDKWYGPSGRNSDQPYTFKRIANSPAGLALRAIGKPLSQTVMEKLRQEATVTCNKADSAQPCHPTESPCLFNVHSDPCEFDNVATEFPSLLQSLLLELEQFNSTAVQPGNLPISPNGNPDHWDHTWNNFGDYQLANLIEMK